jgi:hypothetical protein
MRNPSKNDENQIRTLYLKINVSLFTSAIQIESKDHLLIPFAVA